ncbi:hypothetical protein AAY473_034197 [Plecturocebus cupreus]
MEEDRRPRLYRPGWEGRAEEHTERGGWRALAGRVGGDRRRASLAGHCPPFPCSGLSSHRSRPWGGVRALCPHRPGPAAHPGTRSLPGAEASPADPAATARVPTRPAELKYSGAVMAHCSLHRPGSNDALASVP